MNDVRTSYWQDNAPEPIVADYNGGRFYKNQRVAFNYQGSVKLGTIIELKRSEWKERGYGSWALVFDLHIQGDGAEKISKIKNPNSVVVI
jgi:hypothetical protein